MKFGRRGRRARRRSHAGIILLGAARRIGGHPNQIEAIGVVDGILDDSRCVSSPECTAVRVHDGKTQLWNRSGQVPARKEALTATAQSQPRGDFLVKHLISGGTARCDCFGYAFGTSSICLVAA